jgi:hypothetical protein
MPTGIILFCSLREEADMPPSEPALFVGWHAVEPSPPPLSPLLDTPPVVADPRDLPAAHRRWRARVEADQNRLAAANRGQPVWFPVPTRGDFPVLPVFGGTAGSWSGLVASLALAAGRAGFARFRVANLLRWNVLAGLRELAEVERRFTLRSDTVAAAGSTVDLFAGLTGSELASLLVDVLRAVPGPQGARDAARAKQELLELARMLAGPVTLERLRDALDVALGRRAGAAGSFDPAELRALSDYHADVVSRREATANRLADLHRDLAELAQYRRSSSHQPRRAGTDGPPIRTLQVAAGGGIHEQEIGRELLARAVARGFGELIDGPDLLVVAGAETLASEVLDNLTSSAQRRGKQLVLMFATITDQAERTLGHAGTGSAVFMRLPNHADAKIAAEYLGREFKFVVNGISIAEGETRQWNESYATTTSLTAGHSTTRGRSVTNLGLLARSFGRSFGSTVSRSFTDGTTHSTGRGGMHQRTGTTSAGRVHEHVVEPEVFQRLEENLMLVVDNRRVTLASCDHTISRLPETSTSPLAIP